MKQKKLITLFAFFLSFTYISNAQQHTASNSRKSLNGHEYVDLGLPSGTLWATCNIGANVPMQYGLYFAWGETTQKNKTDYTIPKYKYSKKQKHWGASKYYYNVSEGTGDKKLILDSQDDAAIVNWGENWCMPTTEQFKELIKNCEFELGAFNQVIGVKVTGHNGNYIMLPYAGMMVKISGETNSSLLFCRDEGHYYTKNLYDRNDILAYSLSLENSGRKSVELSERVRGFSIRPVVSPNGMKIIEKSIIDYPNDKVDRLNSPFDDKTYFLELPPTYFAHDEDGLRERFNKLYPELKYSQHLYDEANKGDELAQLLLGYCYYYGIGTTIDKNKAKDILLKSTEMLNEHALLLLFALNLVSTPNEISNFDDFVRIYSSVKTIKVMYDTQKLFGGKILRYNADAKKYFLDHMKVLIDEKYPYPEAMYLYGVVADSINYLSRASNAGLSEATNACAYYFAQRKDYSQAYLYFNKCKSQHFPVHEGDYRFVKQSYMLNADDGKILGEGMKETYYLGDIDAVKQAVQNAKSKGLTSDNIEIVCALIKRDQGNKEEKSNANSILLRYAEAGNVFAQEEIANSYLKGLGFPSIDISKAFQWYKVAARNGSKKAQDFLTGRNLTW